MKLYVCSNRLTCAALGALAALVASASETGSPNTVEIESGTAVFQANTNVAGVEVKGKSGALAGRVEVSREGNGLLVRQIEASIPVKSLATGMKVRDEHMRKYIFTTSDGQEPDLQFQAESANCDGKESSHDYSCQLAGNLSIRGLPRPFRMTLSVKELNGSQSFHAAGDAVVRLNDYGIVPPVQFGVKTQNDVKLHLDFTGKQKPLVASSGGSR